MDEGALESFPPYLREALARLATRDVAAVEVGLAGLRDGSRTLLITGGYVTVDESARLRVNEATRELLSAALAWYHSEHKQLTAEEVADLSAKAFAPLDETQAGLGTSHISQPSLKASSPTLPSQNLADTPFTIDPATLPA